MRQRIVSADVRQTAGQPKRWALRLECGHTVFRPAEKKRRGDGFASPVPKPTKPVECEACDIVAQSKKGQQ